MSGVIETEVADPTWTAALPDVQAVVGETVQAVLAQFDEGGASSVAILLTDDEAVRDLNKRFRDKDKPTNVLSFPALPGPEPMLGDIALAYGVCAAESVEQNKTLREHLQHLVAHGVLHLLGYDHQTDAQAEEMEDLERDILRGLGVPDPYAER